MRGKSDAADWAVRRAMGLAAGEQAQLDAWLAGSRQRRGELAQAEIALAYFERAQAVMPAEATRLPTTRRRALAVGGAAIAAGITALWFVPDGDSLSTRVGEVRRARLSDASVITLNTQSRVSLDLAPTVRRVSLDRGEAWFQVAHDRTRPFIVSAADLRIRAVGTAFSVRRMADGVAVLVTDGTVEVWRADQPTQRARITRDHRAFVPDDSLVIAPVRAKAGIERALAWRDGWLSLDGEGLEFAVSELNRYNRTQLRVDDPGLGRAPIYGLFRLDDPQGFAQMIAEAEAARVEPDGGTLRLIPKTS